ncbi:MAG: LysM peptidoglycan-binding domain-containing protein [Firmicutes bacterium]|nr:LysM peptidoglycan-binding domain-containing protein [Bacillota bacterium]
MNTVRRRTRAQNFLGNWFKIILFAMAIFLFAVAARSGLNAADCSDKTVLCHVVKPGETYWQLAELYFPDRDPREMSYRIKSWNQKSSGELRPGGIVKIYR